VRRRDDPIIYPPPMCAAGCQKPYEQWCRGCNLVFCADDLPREKHNCANRDQRPSATVKPKKQSRKMPESPAPAAIVPPVDGPDLFGKPTPNGVASTPHTH